MRHRVKGRKLGRTASHRKATMRALCTALIKEHRIQTTLAKAKELRTYIEPLITTAKEDNTHNRRKAFSALQDKYAVTELFESVGPAAADRPGGYTRVLKLGFRLGDSAEMAVIELVDFNDVAPELKSAKKKRTRRAGKASKPVAAEAQEGDEVIEPQETLVTDTETVNKDDASDESSIEPADETPGGSDNQEEAVKTEDIKNKQAEIASQESTDDNAADLESDEEKKDATDPESDK